MVATRAAGGAAGGAGGGAGWAVVPPAGGAGAPRAVDAGGLAGAHQQRAPVGHLVVAGQRGRGARDRGTPGALRGRRAWGRARRAHLRGAGGRGASPAVSGRRLGGPAAFHGGGGASPRAGRRRVDRHRLAVRRAPGGAAGRIAAGHRPAIHACSGRPAGRAGTGQRRVRRRLAGPDGPSTPGAAAGSDGAGERVHRPAGLDGPWPRLAIARAVRRAHRHEGEAGGARGRGPGGRSTLGQGAASLPELVRSGVPRGRPARGARVHQRFFRGHGQRLHARLPGGVRCPPGLRPAPASARAGRRGRPRGGDPGAGRLPGDGVRSPAGAGGAPVGGLGPHPAIAGAQSGPRRAREPAGSVRRRRHPRDRGLRPQPFPDPRPAHRAELARALRPAGHAVLQAGFLGRAPGRPSAGLRGERHLAGGAFSGGAVPGQTRAGQAVPRRRQPRVPARGDLFARGCALAGLAVLRVHRLRARERVLAGDAGPVVVRRSHPGDVADHAARPRSAGVFSDARPVARSPGRRCRNVRDKGPAAGAPDGPRRRPLAAPPPDRAGARGQRAAGGRVHVRLHFRSPAGPAGRRGGRHDHPGSRRPPHPAGQLRAVAPARSGGRGRGVHRRFAPGRARAGGARRAPGPTARGPGGAGAGRAAGQGRAFLGGGARALPGGARRGGGADSRGRAPRTDRGRGDLGAAPAGAGLGPGSGHHPRAAPGICTSWPTSAPARSRAGRHWPGQPPPPW